MSIVLALWTVVVMSSGILPGDAWAAKSAGDYLAAVMDRYHGALHVYTDSHAAGNHFVARGRMSSQGDHDAVPPMIERWTEKPRSGCTCIKASFKSKGVNWGGWYFMNGVLTGEAREPSENWGDYPDAGVDLSGATELSFWARGEEGGEWVEFFAFGVGWDPKKPYPDSCDKVSSGYRQLSTEWQQYKLDLHTIYSRNWNCGGKT